MFLFLYSDSKERESEHFEYDLLIIFSENLRVDIHNHSVYYSNELQRIFLYIHISLAIYSLSFCNMYTQCNSCKRAKEIDINVLKRFAECFDSNERISRRRSYAIVVGVNGDGHYL